MTFNHFNPRLLSEDTFRRRRLLSTKDRFLSVGNCSTKNETLSESLVCRIRYSIFAVFVCGHRFFLPPYAAAEIRTHFSRIAPGPFEGRSTD